MPGRRDPAGAALRAHAARLNVRVVNRGESLSQLSADLSAVAERDRSLLRAILAGSLRWHHRFDWCLSRLLNKPTGSLQHELAALLRVGLTQIEVLRIPDHAAVSATVNATADLGLGRARGLVNAVLRRYLRERDALEPDCREDPVARFSHPRWIIDAVRRDWPDQAEAILDANNSLPPLWLRVNRSRISRAAYLERLDAEGIEASAGTSGEDSILIGSPRPVEELPGFDAGLVSVQDIAAQRAAPLMDLAPGQRVLDACAAPGGKTAHMLEICPALAELVAVDNEPERLRQIGSNLERLGLSARLVAGDATTPGNWFDGKPFDRILLDAPCSASGVIRRHPDIKLLRRDSDIDELARTQAGMLDALWPLLVPGGRLVYATCSVFRAENFNVVNAFAARTPDAALAASGSAAHFQLLPGQANSDGFYYACLDKTASNNN